MLGEVGVQWCRIPSRDDRLQHTYVLVLKYDRVVMSRRDRSVKIVHFSSLPVLHAPSRAGH
jgi:hypothetical protein